jgi:HD-GYP domain-containing protein (c-di-GMP phosphodiesterase class II)
VLLAYIGGVTAAAAAVGGLSWAFGDLPSAGPLLLLCAMGVLSFNLREPDVGSRIGFSFLSIILLAAAVIVGPLGAMVVGAVSVAIDRRQGNWYQGLFNMAMSALVGASGAFAYLWAGGSTDIGGVSGVGPMTFEVGLPLMIADVVQALTNALLLAGVIHVHRGIPFVVVLRGVLATSGVAYVGYGVIGFLFVVLWFPAELGPFSALLVLAPLLAARWAFIQYGDELRAHERTIDTLVTALGTKVPIAVGRSRRVAQLAEWVAEEMGLRPHQIGTVRYAAILHDIGLLGVPTRMLRRPASELTEAELAILRAHPVVGAQMIEGIDFLEEARSGIRHQGEWFDGTGGPAGLAGTDIPLAARIVAVASAFEQATREAEEHGFPANIRALVDISREAGERYDPAVVDALRSAMGRHEWPVGATPEVIS